MGCESCFAVTLREASSGRITCDFRHGIAEGDEATATSDGGGADTEQNSSAVPEGKAAPVLSFTEQRLALVIHEALPALPPLVPQTRLRGTSPWVLPFRKRICHHTCHSILHLNGVKSNACTMSC